jgi:hypothetical protein
MAQALRDLGHAAAGSGWRAKVADGAAPRLAARTPVSHDAVRAAIGIAFLALSLLYVGRVIQRYYAARTS